MYSYKNKFFVKQSFGSDLKSIEVVEVIVLMEFKKRDVNYSVFIEPQKWKNIALETISMKNIDSLFSKGAQNTESSLLYDDHLDAIIQMAFVCAKNMIEPHNVYEVSNNIISEKTYKDLLKIFYDDFPEKFI